MDSGERERSVIARMDNVTGVIFRNAERAREEWTTSRKCSAVPQARKQIYKHRYVILIQVIREAGIADEYERWRRENETL